MVFGLAREGVYGGRLGLGEQRKVVADGGSCGAGGGGDLE